MDQERLKQEYWNGVATGAGAFGVIWFLVANWDHTALVVTSAWFYRLLGAAVAVAVFSAWRRVRYSRSLRLDRR